MKKRAVALILCLIMVLPVFAACSNEPVMSYTQMYLSHQIYDLDPLNAYTNDAQLAVVNLVFSGLYKINEKGNIERDLAASETIKNDEQRKEYVISITLQNTLWTDGSAVTANDVVYTVRRIMKANTSNNAAAVLMKIKNAKAVKMGDESIDSLGISAVEEKVVELYFEEPVTNDTLTEIKYAFAAPALFPLREIYVDGKIDWAKKPVTMVFSGPFIVRKVSYESGKCQLMLERNSYYFRNREKDAEDKYVTPYRIYVDYEYELEDQVALFNNGQSLLVGEIPLSLRAEYKNNKNLSVTDRLSTHTYIFNQNAYINGEQLFAKKEVRQALSMAIDRNAIANEIAVFAKPATGLVSYKVFETNSPKKSFRDVGGNILSTSADVDGAKALLKSAGVTASKYSFAITVRSSDELHIAIANAVASAWKELGFKVTVKKLGVEKKKAGEVDATGEVQNDIRDDIFDECYKGMHDTTFDVMAIDYIAKTPDAFSVLAPFAIDFTGNLTVDGKENMVTPHKSGYNSEEYNRLINEAFDASNLSDRAAKLHEAEELLLDDMAVMPVIFNQSATLVSKSISGYTRNYYGYYGFTKLNHKNWQKYNEQYFPEETASAVDIYFDDKKYYSADNL